MAGIGAATAELGALGATALAVAAAVPQLARVVVRRDCQGVSVTSVALGVGTESAWLVYAVGGSLWLAAPEAIVMAVANVALWVALVRRGASARRAWPAGALWALTLAASGTVGGPRVLAAMLAGGYAVQVAPAVWTAWTTPRPSGVAAATWVMVGIEGVLWGAYGSHHGDPATSSFAVIAVVAATAMLARKALVARRLVSVDT